MKSGWASAVAIIAVLVSYHRNASVEGSRLGQRAARWVKEAETFTKFEMNMNNEDYISCSGSQEYRCRKGAFCAIKCMEHTCGNPGNKVDRGSMGSPGWGWCQRCKHCSAQLALKGTCNECKPPEVQKKQFSRKEPKGTAVDLSNCTGFKLAFPAPQIKTAAGGFLKDVFKVIHSRLTFICHKPLVFNQPIAANPFCVEGNVSSVFHDVCACGVAKAGGSCKTENDREDIVPAIFTTLAHCADTFMGTLSNEVFYQKPVGDPVATAKQCAGEANLGDPFAAIAGVVHVEIWCY